MQWLGYQHFINWYLILSRVNWCTKPCKIGCNQLTCKPCPSWWARWCFWRVLLFFPKDYNPQSHIKPRKRDFRMKVSTIRDQPKNRYTNRCQEDSRQILTSHFWTFKRNLCENWDQGRFSRCFQLQSPNNLYIVEFLVCLDSFNWQNPTNPRQSLAKPI